MLPFWLIQNLQQQYEDEDPNNKIPKKFISPSFFVNLITSEIYRSACLRSSPINNTIDVVPSPVISSCAVAARAINDAVGC